jgi:capsular polysaccharide transport system permease protein
VVFALVFKEFKQKLSRGRLGLLWTLMEPLVHMIILSSLWYFIGRETINGISILLFVASGIFPFLIFRRSVSVVARSIGKNKSLMDYPQVKPIDPLIASFIVEMVLLIAAVGILYTGLYWFLDIKPEIPDPLRALGVLSILGVGGIGLALIVGVLGHFDEGVFSIVKMVTRPMLFISAVFYGASQLPPGAIEYLKWNPVLQVIEYYRFYFLGNPIFEQANIRFPILCSFVAIIFGVMLYYNNRYKLIQR